MTQDAIGANILVYAYQFFPATNFRVVTEIDDAEDVLGATTEE